MLFGRAVTQTFPIDGHIVGAFGIYDIWSIASVSFINGLDCRQKQTTS